MAEEIAAELGADVAAGLDKADGAALGAPDDRLGGSRTAQKSNPAQQSAMDDAGRRTPHPPLRKTEYSLPDHCPSI